MYYGKHQPHPVLLLTLHHVTFDTQKQSNEPRHCTMLPLIHTSNLMNPNKDRKQKTGN